MHAPITCFYMYACPIYLYISIGISKITIFFHVHSVNYAAKLVYIRHALSSIIINSNQEPVSGQACNPTNPLWFLFLW